MVLASLLVCVLAACTSPAGGAADAWLSTPPKDRLITAISAADLDGDARQATISSHSVFRPCHLCE